MERDADNKWLAEDRVLRAAAAEARKAAAFTAWVLADIERTRRKKAAAAFAQAAAAACAKRAADQAARAAEERAARDARQIRMALERREAANARDLNYEDACFGF